MEELSEPAPPHPVTAQSTMECGNQCQRPLMLAQLPAYNTASLIGNVSFPKADTGRHWACFLWTRNHWQTFGVHPLQILASIKVYNPIRTKLILRSA